MAARETYGSTSKGGVFEVIMVIMVLMVIMVRVRVKIRGYLWVNHKNGSTSLTNLGVIFHPFLSAFDT